MTFFDDHKMIRDIFVNASGTIAAATFLLVLAAFVGVGQYDGQHFRYLVVVSTIAFFLMVCWVALCVKVLNTIDNSIETYHHPVRKFLVGLLFWVVAGGAVILGIWLTPFVGNLVDNVGVSVSGYDSEDPDQDCIFCQKDTTPGTRDSLTTVPPPIEPSTTPIDTPSPSDEPT